MRLQRYLSFFLVACVCVLGFSARRASAQSTGVATEKSKLEAGDASAPRLVASIGADAGLTPRAVLAGDAGTGAIPAAEVASPGDLDGGAGDLANLPGAPTLRLPPSEVEKANGLNVIRIDVAGNRRVSSDDVLTYMRLRKGQPFRQETLANDVRALWDSGFFDDVEVDLARTDTGVILRFLVRERPSVKGIEFVGNEEIDNEKLLEAVEVKPNTSLSIPAVRRSIQKIKDAYGEKGYYLADVDHTVEPERDNEVTVRFKIVEHQSVTVRRVNFVGNVEVSDKDLRELMATGQSSPFSFGSGGAFRQDALERDVLILSALYYDRGFLNVQIGTPRVMLTPDREGIEITLVIHEGPRFKIRSLRVYERDNDGKEVEPLGGRRALRQLIRAQSGDFFNRAELVKDLTAVRTLYRDAGFANVESEPETEPNVKERLVDLVVPIRRGPLVRIERIEVKGNTKTRDKVVRREMDIEEGQLFSETKLEDSKRRIMSLGFFERVDMSTEQGSSPDKMIARFEVAEKQTGTFQVGAGFSSVENLIATAQIQQANLFGNGHNVSFQLQWSGLRRSFNLRFFEPYLFDSDWSSSVELFSQRYVFPSFSRDTSGGSLTFGYGLVQPWLRLSLTATAQYDSVDTEQSTTFFGSAPTAATATANLPLANLYNNGRTISLRPAITYDTRDNRIFPTGGLYVSASTEFANQIFGSQIEFLKHTVNARVYFPLGGQTAQPGSGFVLKANANFGLITSPNAAGVPVFARYFLGGILDMRGYQLRSVGPALPLNQGLDPNALPNAIGSSFGGNLQAYANTEFEFPILDKVGIRGVGFFDFGNAWNLEDQYCRNTPAPQFPVVVQPCWRGISSLGSLRTSVGAGIRWFSPLGPLRFEWGFPISRQSYEKANVFEFTIGNFF
jgi:outer membrane protein insertion porin family